MDVGSAVNCVTVGADGVGVGAGGGGATTGAGGGVAATFFLHPPANTASAIASPMTVKFRLLNMNILSSNSRYFPQTGVVFSPAEVKAFTCVPSAAMEYI